MNQQILAHDQKKEKKLGMSSEHMRRATVSKEDQRNKQNKKANSL